MNPEFTREYLIDPHAGTSIIIKKWQEALDSICMSQKNPNLINYVYTDFNKRYVLPLNHPYLVYKDDCAKKHEKLEYQTLKEFMKQYDTPRQRKITNDDVGARCETIVPHRSSNEDMQQIVKRSPSPPRKIRLIERYKPQLKYLKSLDEERYKIVRYRLRVDKEDTLEDALAKFPDLLKQINEFMKNRREEIRSGERRESQESVLSSVASEISDTSSVNSLNVIEDVQDNMQVDAGIITPSQEIIPAAPSMQDQTVIMLQQQILELQTSHSQQQFQFNLLNENLMKLTTSLNLKFNEDAAQRQQIMAYAEANTQNASAQLQQIAAEVQNTRYRADSVATALEEKLKITQAEVKEAKAEVIEAKAEALEVKEKILLANKSVEEKAWPDEDSKPESIDDIMNTSNIPLQQPSRRRKSSVDNSRFQPRQTIRKRSTITSIPAPNSAIFSSTFGNQVIDNLAVNNMTQPRTQLNNFALGPQDSPGFNFRTNGNINVNNSRNTEEPLVSIPSVTQPSPFNDPLQRRYSSSVQPENNPAPSPELSFNSPNPHMGNGGADENRRNNGNRRNSYFSNPTSGFDVSTSYDLPNNDRNGNGGLPNRNGNGNGANQPPNPPRFNMAELPYQFPNGRGFPPAPLIVPAIKPPKLDDLRVPAVRLFCEEYAAYQRLFKDQPEHVKTYVMHSKVYCIHRDTLHQLALILDIPPNDVKDQDFTRWANEHLGRRLDEYEKDIFQICEDGLHWDYKLRDPALVVSAYLQRFIKLLREHALTHLLEQQDQRILCKVLRQNLPSNLAKEMKKHQDQIDPIVGRDVATFNRVLTNIIKKQSYGLALGEISSKKSRPKKHDKDSSDKDRRDRSRSRSRGRSHERSHRKSSYQSDKSKDRNRSRSYDRKSSFNRKYSDSKYEDKSRVKVNNLIKTPEKKTTWSDSRSPGRGGYTPARTAQSPYKQPEARLTPIPPLKLGDQRPAQQRNVHTATVAIAPQEFAHIRANSINPVEALPKVVTPYLDGRDINSFNEYRPLHRLAFNALKTQDQERQKFIQAQIEHFSGHDRSILINKVPVGKYKLDNGADESILSTDHLAQLTAIGVKFELYQCTPCYVSLAFGKDEVLVHTAVKADLVLNTVCGPLSLRGVTALVINQPMEHVLLGEPLIKDILPDLDAELGKLALKLQQKPVEVTHKIPPRGEKQPELQEKIKVEAVQIQVKSTINKLVPKSHIEKTDVQNCVDKVYEAEKRDEELVSIENMPAELAEKVGFTSEFDTSEDPVLPSTPEIGIDDPKEKWKVLQQRINEAAEAGMEPEAVKKLTDIIWEFQDRFSIKLEPDAGANVPPMKAHLKPDAVPKRCYPRKYSAHHSKFMNDMVNELEKCNMIYRNSAATWASPMYPIPKPHQEGVPMLEKKLRLVNDVRYPNSQCVRTMWPMPNFETITDRLKGSKYYFVLDLFKGYWQFPMDKLAQEIYSFMTDRGVYSSYRLIQGACDAVPYFQATIAFVFVEFYLTLLLIWLDDLFGHSKDYDQYFALLRYVLQVCRDRNIKLSAEKCVLFTKEAEWCGRIISHEGIRYNPKKLQGLIDLQFPRTAKDLMEFVYAFGWMRSHIPDFAKLVEPLNEVITLAFDTVKAPTRRKNHVKNVLLTKLGWSEEQINCVKACKNELMRMMAMNFPDPRQALCLFTDASLTHWGGIITQVPPEDMSLPFAEQRHSPLGCVSGAFRESSRHWPIIEKEAYAIVETISRFHYLTAQPQGFYIFCDHANLIYLFSPLPSSALLSKTTEAKLLRWRLSIASYHYVIEHIAGDDNVWADLLSRWGGGSVLTIPSKKFVNVIYINTAFIDAVTRSKKQLTAPEVNSDRFTEVEEIITPESTLIKNTNDNVEEIVNTPTAKAPKNNESVSDILRLPSPMRHEDFEAPTLEAVRAAQQEAPAVQMKKLIQDDQDLFRNEENLIWIPEAAKDLQLRLMIIAHCGPMGHRGVEPTYLRLKAVFIWNNMKIDVKVFVKKCIHCVANGGGNLTRVPLGHSIQGTKPNEVLHMDYVYICEKGYLLTLKDSFSKYLIHHYCTELSAAVTLQAVLHWISLFGIPKVWVSDQGSHFANELVKAFREVWTVKQHLTIAYCPWSNGVIERPHRDTLTCLRKLRTEFNLPPEEWIKLLPLLQFNANHTPVRSLNNYAPITVFTGLQPTSTIDQFIQSQAVEFNQEEINVNAIKKHVNKLSKYLRDVHSCSFNAAEIARENSRNARNNTANPITLAIGDYVLRATDITVARTKTYARWSGPYVIIDILGNHVFQLKDLVNNKEFPCHAARLRFYSDSSLNVTEELITYITSAQQGFEISKILDYYLGTDDEYYFSVRWFGFEADADTWEPLSVLLVDAPTVLKNFVKTKKVSAKDRSAIEAVIRKRSVMPP